MRSLLDLEGLVRVLKQLNAERLSAVERGLSISALRDSDAEQLIELLFHPSQALAVYGTLAPGQPNEWVLDGIDGGWQNGLVRGQKYASGWGAAVGYPGMVWDDNASPQPVHVFHAQTLEQHWARLDEFEGDGYVRILVPVESPTPSAMSQGNLMAIANLYALHPRSLPPE